MSDGCAWVQKNFVWQTEVLIEKMSDSEIVQWKKVNQPTNIKPT